MATSSNLEVELPAGGKLHLQTVEEVDLWERTEDKYRSEYALVKTNDLVMLGSLLTQNLALFRATQAINGMEPQLDAQGHPTGQYVRKTLSINDQAKAQGMILKASEEIRKIEAALGIDKKTRDQGGGDSVAEYLEELRMAGRQLGVHITKRVKAYEEFAMELRWRLRILWNADDEDRAKHGITEESILKWATNRLAELEEIDQQFAKTKASIFAGRL